MRRLRHALLRRWHALCDWIYACEARLEGVRLGRGVKVQGRPRILLLQGKISLGEGTWICSRDYGYQTQITAPVKLFVDAPGASIEIGPRCRIYGSVIHAKDSISIGEDCLIAAGCTIIDQDGHVLDGPARARGDRDEPKPVRIGKRVWLGAGVTILKGVELGDDVVVAAGSVVSHSVRSGVLCGGVPARVITRIVPDADEAGQEAG